MIALGICKVISLNVTGLTNREKRRTVFCFLKDQNCDVFFLQETYSEPNDENVYVYVYVCVYVMGHSPSGLFRTNGNRQ